MSHTYPSPGLVQYVYTHTYDSLLSLLRFVFLRSALVVTCERKNFSLAFVVFEIDSNSFINSCQVQIIQIEFSWAADTHPLRPRRP